MRCRRCWRRGLSLLCSEPENQRSKSTLAAAAVPGRIGIRFGYDEDLAHLIQGGADVIAVPSRFEPCGPHSALCAALWRAAAGGAHRRAGGHCDRCKRNGSGGRHRHGVPVRASYGPGAGVGTGPDGTALAGQSDVAAAARQRDGKRCRLDAAGAAVCGAVSGRRAGLMPRVSAVIPAGERLIHDRHSRATIIPGRVEKSDSSPAGHA